MIVLSTTDLTLRFGTTSVLEKVSFSVDERDKLGIIGVNGSGKSSLFKLLTGEYEPTEGEGTRTTLVDNNGGKVVSCAISLDTLAMFLPTDDG